jgi:hypothetical protein
MFAKVVALTECRSRLKRSAFDTSDALRIERRADGELPRLGYSVPCTAGEVPPDFSGISRRDANAVIHEARPRTSPIAGEPVECR